MRLTSSALLERSSEEETNRLPATPTPHAAFLSQRVFGSLDGLRAAAILAVIWHHTQDGGVAWLPGSRLGFLGVDLFFAISGFLIVTLLLRERSATSEISLRKFYMRRTLRIFPVYYAVLFTLSVYFLVRDSEDAGQFWAELPYYLTYTSNWIPAVIVPLAWSLATEQQFYLFWPPVEKLLAKAVIPVMLGVIVVCQLVNFEVLIGAPDTWIGRHRSELPILQATFTPICFGVLLAHALNDRRGFAWSHRLLGSPRAAIIVTIILLGICNLPIIDGSGSHRLAIQALLTALVAACVVVETNGLQSLLRRGVMIRIGVVSYGMYLYHPLVGDLAHALGLGASQLGRFACTAVGAYVVAELSYRYFEARFTELKTRFAT